MFSQTEENYLKAIYKLSEKDNKSVATNSIASKMHTSAASVTDMIKKLSEKELVNYEKYHGVTLTKFGKKYATELIRRHRLWEYFLVEKLKFSWEKVHDIAEQLEHINSETLITRLNNYLGNPKFDPHGDPIPNSEGKFTIRRQSPLTDLFPQNECILIGVKEHDRPFLEYLNHLNIGLGTKIKILEKIPFEESYRILISEKKETTISKKIGQLLLVRKV